MSENIIKTYKINNSSVKVAFGDLLSSRAEALVISGSVGLPMSGGLPEYVRKTGGECIGTDAHKHYDSKLGDVVVTSAGSLSNKYLFHAITVTQGCAVLPHLTSEENTDVHEYIIGHLIARCMKLMFAMDLDSIAFPCLGLGMGNIPVDIVAQKMAQTICDFLSRTQKSITVEIYIRDLYDVYKQFDYLPFFEWFATYAYQFDNKIEPSADPDNQFLTTSSPQGASRLETELERIDKKPHMVFFSYSRKDKDKADAICQLLDEMDISYWIDRNGVYSGSNFKELIVKAIQDTAIVLFLSSENSNTSDNVAKEISIADQFRKTIIPVRLDEAPMHPKIAYDLAAIDFLNLFTFDQLSVCRLRNAILAQLTMSKSK